MKRRGKKQVMREIVIEKRGKDIRDWLKKVSDPLP
jgi:hypothetical protein